MLGSPPCLPAAAAWELGLAGVRRGAAEGETGPPRRAPAARLWEASLQGTGLRGAQNQGDYLPQPHCIPKQGEGLSITPIPLWILS